MDLFFDIDWNELFVPSISVVEIILRGTLTYLALFTLIRLVSKRETGAVGMADLLMIVLIADAAQNAMSSDYRSITEGVILVATIVFWTYAIDWLAYHFPPLQRILQAQPLMLVKDGQMLRRNMRKELITEEELLGELRKHGLDAVEKVKEAIMEEDGSISIVKREG